MKYREFSINTENFNLDFYDSVHTNVILECLEDDLEVPNDCIESLEIHEDRVDIKLSKTKRYFNEDWYINLQRVA